MNGDLVKLSPGKDFDIHKTPLSRKCASVAISESGDSLEMSGSHVGKYPEVTELNNALRMFTCHS